MFSLDILVAWWLWRANQEGIEVADSDLENFLIREETEVLSVLWLHGVEARETIQITDGISLVPVSQMIDCGHKEEVLRSQSQIETYRSPVTTAALTLTGKTKKIWRSDARDEFRMFHSLHTQPLHDAALLLNCLSGVSCVGGAQSMYCPPNVPFGPFGSGGRSGSAGEILPQNRASIVKEIPPIFCDLFSAFSCLQGKWKDQVTRALGRLQQAKCRRNLEDKALDLGIALEMVLLFSEHKNREFPDQLSNHLRLRGTWLVDGGFSERKKNFGILGKIYTHRSEVAHSGTLRDTKKDRRETKELIDCHVELAERIIQKLILNGGPPNWSGLVLGKALMTEPESGSS